MKPVNPAASRAPKAAEGRGAWDEREEDLENQLNRSAMWAVTYGDLMSYLMIFFLLLYVATSTRSVGMQMSIKAAEQRFANDAQTIEQLFTKYGAQKIARLVIGENKIRIVFEAPVLFESGSAYLKSESIPVLSQIVKSLNDMPNSIQIEGHTDDRPLGRGSKFSSNWELSSARAFAVLRFLEINGIPEQRLSATGYGEFRPAASNATPEGRSVNRRIEINIMRRED
jgi:chemotaxis protein MotB